MVSSIAVSKSEIAKLTCLNNLLSTSLIPHISESYAQLEIFPKLIYHHKLLFRSQFDSIREDHQTSKICGCSLAYRYFHLQQIVKNTNKHTGMFNSFIIYHVFNCTCTHIQFFITYHVFMYYSPVWYIHAILHVFIYIFYIRNVSSDDCILFRSFMWVFVISWVICFSLKNKSFSFQ